MNYLQECHKMALLFCIFASRKQTNKKNDYEYQKC